MGGTFSSRMAISVCRAAGNDRPSFGDRVRSGWHGHEIPQSITATEESLGGLVSELESAN